VISIIPDSCGSSDFRIDGEGGERDLGFVAMLQIIRHNSRITLGKPRDRGVHKEITRADT